MRDFNRMHTSPIAVQRSRRNHTVTAMTSLPAGKMVPLAAIPLLREDQLRNANFRFSFEMMETAELLMNPVNVTLKAYLVPWLAMERFEGSMDQFNRSYKGEPQVEGGDVIPFFEEIPFARHDFYKYLGFHGVPVADKVNSMYLEAYNQVWNFRAKNRSPKIELRDRLDNTLAPAFWQHSRFSHIVPDFDQALIEGEIALDFINSRAPVSGIGFETPKPTGAGSPLANQIVSATEGNSILPYAMRINDGMTPSIESFGQKVLIESDSQGLIPQIFAELRESGVTLTLASIDLARQTQAFARARTAYNMHEEYIIEMLMDGLNIPDQSLKQPILIGQGSTIFGMSKRYATDSGNLTESAVNGNTFIDLRLNTPRVGTGAVVIITAEILPEQMFERQRDPFLFCTSPEELPEYLRDTLDPEKVSVVPNGHIDATHSNPDSPFGYAPLNHEWMINAPRLGGKMYRPSASAEFDEDRQRVWAVETADPILSADFYIAHEVHTKPFLVTNKDPFEVVVLGGAEIVGNTVFGPALLEAKFEESDYEKIRDKVPLDKLDRPGTPPTIPSP